MKRHTKKTTIYALSFVMIVNLMLSGCGSAQPDESGAGSGSSVITSSESRESTEATEAVTTSAVSVATEEAGTTAEGSEKNSATTAFSSITEKATTSAASTKKTAGTTSSAKGTSGKTAAAGSTQRAVTTAASAQTTTASKKAAATAKATQAAAAAPTEADKDINVPYIEGTTDKDGFIRGMDVSTVLSLYESWKASDGSAHFKDFNGRELDIQGFFKLLHDNGTNYIRLRVWNDPFDSKGNGYGGGNVDINAAVTMGKYATKAGMRVLIDFHYSDFWADPSKQQAPKAWEGMSIDEKEAALYSYTADCMKKLRDAGVDVGMVQIGNETTGNMCGENRWDNICRLFSAGSKAVREADSGILVAVHFTNPEKASSYKTYAKQLSSHGVDYDVFASSWYPYWHGTLTNLTSVLKDVSDAYGKKVMVAETSWAYTLKDGDGYGNTVNSSSASYEISAQGQADLICDVIKAVKAVGKNGIGVFYWEPAWIPVQVYGGSSSKLSENKALWEKYGSGWASSFSAEYDPNDAGKWYGGSAWDNQAMFAFDGTPLASLKTYKYIQTK